MDQRDNLQQKNEELARDFELERLNARDYEKKLRLYEENPVEHRKIAQLEKQLELRNEKHASEIKEFNEQIERTYKQFKDVEKQLFDSEQMVRLDLFSWPNSSSWLWWAQEYRP